MPRTRAPVSQRAPFIDLGKSKNGDEDLPLRHAAGLQ